jgi:16S rRNA (guanine527-N7)-methyltransferase
VKNNPALIIQRELHDLSVGMDILKIKYDQIILAKFRSYLNILFQYKDKLHLLSHKDYACIARRHFLPALLAQDHVHDKHRVCDIGTGPGFPSMPIKIIKPTIDLTLIEAKRKKADFLEVLTRELAFPEVNVVNERAQSFSGQMFDIILLKAVGKIKTLIDLMCDMLVPNGKAIFYKNHEVEQEIDRARKKIELNKMNVRVEKLFTPLEHLPLGLVILQKTR